MAEITSKYLFYVCLCMFFSNFVSTNLCNEKNPCLCRFSEHEILDISNVTKKDIYLKASWKSFDFFYSPCHNMDMKLNPKTCQNTSLCLSQVNTTSTILVTDLGNTSIAKFESVEKPIKLIFSVGEITSVIQLVCAPDMIQPSLFVNPIEKKNYYELLLVTKHACPFHIKEDDQSLSTGSALLILFTVGAVIYFCAGACLLYYLRGARGVEVIPNIDFWRGLPSLVRDGFLFLLNGCRLPSTMTATAETYDKI